MSDTLKTTAVKAESLKRATNEPRWLLYGLPFLAGFIGAIGLFALYLIIVTIAQGGSHAIELLSQDAWLVIPIMIGFGIQVGLYTHLRGVIPQGSRSSKMMVGMGGGTSTAAMVACCAHHLADVLPLLGLSAAASFLAVYKIPFMFMGLGMNLIGIVVILRTIRKVQRHLAMMEGH